MYNLPSNAGYKGPPVPKKPREQGTSMWDRPLCTTISLHSLKEGYMSHAAFKIPGSTYCT